LSRRQRRLFFVAFTQDRHGGGAGTASNYVGTFALTGGWTSTPDRAMLSPVRRAMSDKRSMESGAVCFSERLASSQVFAVLFRDGMALVEETASYLDGPGRQESKRLERGAALVYATESMRLTTRLMQLASWLLLHRAVKEGEMTLAQASKEKAKVRLASCEPGDARSVALLPLKLQELIARSVKLQAGVRRLDATMHAAAPVKIAMGNPVERQWGLLKAAFESEA
jgi:regulator of CtrA degradation